MSEVQGVLRPEKILLATDGSPDANLAARAAADLARRSGAELHVAHAWHHVQSAGYPTVGWADYSYLYEREARRLLASCVDEIEAAGDAVAAQHLLQGPAIDALLDLCDEAQPGLLILGSRGLGPVGRLVLGSVSEGLGHHARVPVLVVRGGDPAWPPARVIVGDEGSDAARRAAELALGLGRLFGSEGLLVRAHRNPPEPIGGWSETDRRRLDEDRMADHKDLAARAQSLGRTSGRPPATKTIEGDAALALLMAAEEGDERSTLIAVGSRGRGAFGRFRLGSVSTNVLRTATGPVLICPPPQAASPPPGLPPQTTHNTKSNRRGWA